MCKATLPRMLICIRRCYGGIVPLMLFWQCRLWMSTTRNYMHDDPIVYAARDWVSWAVFAALIGFVASAWLPAGDLGERGKPSGGAPVAFAASPLRALDIDATALALCAALVVTRVIAFAYFLVFDDAFITFRYARNLAEGHGYLYNAGDWVLGTTAPLFGLLASLIVAVGGAPEPSPWINIAVDLDCAAGAAASFRDDRLGFAFFIVCSSRCGRRRCWRASPSARWKSISSCSAASALSRSIAAGACSSPLLLAPPPISCARKRCWSLPCCAPPSCCSRAGRGGRSRWARWLWRSSCPACHHATGLRSFPCRNP